MLDHLQYSFLLNIKLRFPEHSPGQAFCTVPSLSLQLLLLSNPNWAHLLIVWMKMPVVNDFSSEGELSPHINMRGKSRQKVVYAKAIDMR